MGTYSYNFVDVKVGGVWRCLGPDLAYFHPSWDVELFHKDFEDPDWNLHCDYARYFFLTEVRGDNEAVNPITLFEFGSYAKPDDVSLGVARLFGVAECPRTDLGSISKSSLEYGPREGDYYKLWYLPLSALVEFNWNRPWHEGTDESVAARFPALKKMVDTLASLDYEEVRIFCCYG